MFFLTAQIDTLKVGDVLQVSFIGYEYEVKTIIDNNGYALVQPFGYFKLANLDLISAQDSIFQKIKDVYPLARVSIVILNKLLPKVYIITNKNFSAVLDYQKGMTIRFLLLSSVKFPEDKIDRILLIRNKKATVVRESDYDKEVLPNDILKIYIKEEFKWQDLLSFIGFLTSTITLLILLGVITPK